MKSKTFFYATIVAFGGFVFGLDAAVISGTIKFITTEFGLNDIEIGTVVSAPGFGVIFALLATGYLSDKLGRKGTLILIASLYLISAIASTFAPNFIALVVARFVGGLAFTSLSVAAMYIGEIAPANMRGKLVAMNQMNIVIGLSAAYFVNYLILQLSADPNNWLSQMGMNQHQWRWMLGSEVIPAILWLGLLFLVPQSPRWLMLVNRPQDARKVLTKILPKYEVETEMVALQKSVLQDDNSNQSFLSQVGMLFDKKMRKVFWIGFIVAAVQPITGINSILFYAPTIFEQVGVGTDAAFAQSVYVGLCSLVFTFLALLLVDRLGRRPLTLFGLAWAAISLLICAYGFHQGIYKITPEALTAFADKINLESIQDLLNVEFSSDVSFKHELQKRIGESVLRENESVIFQATATLPAGLILFGILSFISAFQFSIGPMLWILLSEIFPTKLRGIAIPAFAFVTSVLSYFVQQFFPWQLTQMGARDIFIFYATLTTIGMILLYRILPETKNKSIEEIEEALQTTVSENPVETFI